MPALGEGELEDLLNQHYDGPGATNEVEESGGLQAAQEAARKAWWEPLATKTKAAYKTVYKKWLQWLAAKRIAEPEGEWSGLAHPPLKVSRFAKDENALSKELGHNTVNQNEKLVSAMTTLRRVQVGVPDSGSLSGLTTIRATTKDAQLSLADVIRSAGDCAGIFAESIVTSTERVHMIVGGYNRCFSAERGYGMQDFLLASRLALVLTTWRDAGLRYDDAKGVVFSKLMLPESLEAHPVRMQQVAYGTTYGKGLEKKVDRVHWMAFVPHVDPVLCSVGTLAENLVLNIHVLLRDPLELILAGDDSWASMGPFAIDPNEDGNVPYWRFEKLIKDILVFLGMDKDAFCHLCRNAGMVELKARGADHPTIRFWARHSDESVLDKNYLVKSPTALAEACALLAGFGKDWRNEYRVGRLLVPVPDDWVDAVVPCARSALQHAEDQIRTLGKTELRRKAVKFCNVALHLGGVFWAHLLFRIQAFGKDYPTATLPAVKAVLESAEWEAYAGKVLESHKMQLDVHNANQKDMTYQLLSERQGREVQLTVAPPPQLPPATQAAPGPRTMPRLFSPTIKTATEAYREFYYGLNGSKSVQETMRENVAAGMLLGSANSTALSKNKPLVALVDQRKAQGAPEHLALAALEELHNACRKRSAEEKTGSKFTLAMLREGVRMCFDSSTGKVIAPAAEQLVSYSCVPATYFAELLRLYLHAPAPGHGAQQPQQASLPQQQQLPLVAGAGALGAGGALVWAPAPLMGGFVPALAAAGAFAPALVPQPAFGPALLAPHAGLLPAYAGALAGAQAGVLHGVPVALPGWPRVVGTTPADAAQLQRGGQN